MTLCCLLLLILFCLVRHFFRSDVDCDEAVCYVLCPVLWDFVLLDEEYGVGACVCVTAWHALGQAANIVPVGMRPSLSHLGVSNEVMVFKHFVVFTND